MSLQRHRLSHSCGAALGLLILCVHLVGCQSSARMGSQYAEIVEAVMYANRLEQELWRQPDRFTSRDDVYRHFRQGFTDELAQNLAAYAWSDEQQSLRPSDTTMLPPSEVRVLSANGTQAVVLYATPTELQELWDEKPFTITRLIAENQRWLIASSEGVDEPPDQKP